MKNETNTESTDTITVVNEVKKCFNCKAVLTADDDFFEDGADFCESCYKEKYTTCDRCSEVTERDESQYIESIEQVYCDNCRDNHLFQCEGCDDYFDNDEYYSVGDDRLCQNCYENDAFLCNGCEDSYYDTNTNYCENCDTDFCEDCYSDESRHSCNAKLSEDKFRRGKNCKKMPFSDYVGIELEMFGNGSSPQFDFVNVSDDGSIAPDDGESTAEITTLPASGNILVEQVEALSSDLKANGWKVNKSCGFHVHIDCRKLKEKPVKISHMLLTYYAFEDILYSMLPKSRWDNTYAKALFTDYKFEDLLNNKMEKLGRKWYKTTYGTNRDHYDSSRYHDFNVHSLFYRGTLEVRMHSGTIDSEKILNWIYLLLKMKQWSQNKYDKKLIKKANKMKTGKKKAELFFKTFNLNEELTSYVKNRILKFNPTILKDNKDNYWSVKKELQVDTNKINQISRKVNDMERDIYSKVYDNASIGMALRGTADQRELKAREAMENNKTLKLMAKKCAKLKHIEEMKAVKMRELYRQAPTAE